LVIRLTNWLGAGSLGMGGESALAACGLARAMAKTMLVFVLIVPPVVGSPRRYEGSMNRR
jgi:hypothetical protein